VHSPGTSAIPSYWYSRNLCRSCTYAGHRGDGQRDKKPRRVEVLLPYLRTIQHPTFPSKKQYSNTMDVDADSDLKSPLESGTYTIFSKAYDLPVSRNIREDRSLLPKGVFTHPKLLLPRLSKVRLRS